MSGHLDDMIPLAGGAYRIGADAAVAARLVRRGSRTPLRPEFIYNAVPAHEVVIEACAVAARLVTVDEFARFVEATGYQTEAEREGWGWTWGENGWMRQSGLTWRSPFGADADRHYLSHGERFPVIQVSWNDATAYCRWYGVMKQRTMTLPTEAQWEVFARRSGYAGYDRVIEASDDNRGPIERMMDAVLRSEGVVLGIVWEWTADWFHAYPGGAASRDHGSVYRVLRGGSVMSHPVQRTCEFRLRKCPTARSPFYGFRIAMV